MRRLCDSLRDYLSRGLFRPATILPAKNNYPPAGRLRMQLRINGQRTHADADPATPLLWVLRDQLNLTGTKFGCGIAACGACTVHVDGQAVRSCVTPVSAVQGKDIRTIESLGSAEQPHALQQAWIAEQVPQCGYCQSGMLMAAAALLARTPKPTDADIDAAMSNICRCGTYQRVRAAIHRAANSVSSGATKSASNSAAPKASRSAA